MKFIFVYDLLMDEKIFLEKYPEAKSIGSFKLQKTGIGVFFDVKIGASLVVPNLGLEQNEIPIYGYVFSVENSYIREMKLLKNQVFYDKLKAVPVKKTIGPDNRILQSIDVLVPMFKVDPVTRVNFIPSQKYLKKLVELMLKLNFPKQYLNYIIKKSIPL